MAIEELRVLVEHGVFKIVQWNPRSQEFVTLFKQETEETKIPKILGTAIVNRIWIEDAQTLVVCVN